jgi:hypothetical protein
MGEFSFIKGIKSVEDGTPSFCVRGIKVFEHLGPLLTQLNVDCGKKEAEMDVINVSCDGDKVNIIFGECKVNKYISGCASYSIAPLVFFYFEAHSAVFALFIKLRAKYLTR